VSRTVFSAAGGSLASEMIPAGRLGGPERTPETAELPAAALPVDRDGVHAVQARGVACLPAVVVIRRR